MSNKKAIILLLFIAVIGVIFAVSAQSYPIAIVDWKPVIYGDLNKNYDAAVIYYQKAVLTYNTANAEIMKSSEVKEEIRRAGLEASIEDVLVLNELVKRLGGSEAQTQIEKSVEAAIQGKDIEKEIKELYGLSSAEFINRFLKPQVRREILEARLRLENALPNGSFKEWLENAKQQAGVMIFLPGFEWKGGTVIVKK